jgi:hypothetical protein
MSLIRSEQLRMPLTGSFTGSFVGSLSGSLSGSATDAITASYAHTASFVATALTASYVSGSNVKGQVESASVAGRVISASYAETSSFTEYVVRTINADTASSADDFYIRGNLKVDGSASIKYLYVDVITSSINYSTGSNTFGDSVSLDVQELTGSVGITGSLTMDTSSVATIPNLTGSLYGTASYANFALSASYVPGLDTASYANFALSASNADTASYALAVSGGGDGSFRGQFTGSLTGSVFGTFSGSAQATVTGSLLGTASHAIYADTASLALTASYAMNVPETASYAITASYALSVSGGGSGNFNGNFSGSFTGSLDGSASYAFFAVSASYAADSDYADLAGTASWAQQAISSSTADSASTSLVAISSSYATSASSADYAYLASYATSSISSSYAATASLAYFVETASYIATASWAYNAITASHAINALTASYALTSSVMVEGTASGQFTGNFIGNVVGTSSWSETSSVAYNLQDTASQAWTASFVELANSASFVISASYVINAEFATSSLSASFAEEALYVSASGIVGYQNMIVSGSGAGAASASFLGTGSLMLNVGLNADGLVSASEGFTGYLYDTASQAETASFANSFRILSGAVLLDGGLTIFNKSSSLSGSQINNGIRFRNEGPTGDTWNIFAEDEDRSLRFGITDTTHSAYRINNYLHQVNADNPVNIFSSADGGGGVIIASLTYEGQGQPNQVWGMWTTASNYTQYITQSYIDSGGIFIGTASFALNAAGNNGTASWAESASYAWTASVAYTVIAPPGRTIFHTQTTPSTNWEFTHSLGTLYPNYTVFDLNNNVILPANLRSDNVSSSTLTFTYPQAGTVVATVGGGLPALSSSYKGYVLQVDQSGFLAEWRSTLLLSGSQQYAETASYGENFNASGSFTSFGTSSLSGSVGITGSVDVTGSFEITGSTFITGTLDITGSVTLNGVAIGTPYVQNFSNANTWSINHGLGNQYVQVQTFDTNNEMFFPETINLTDAYTASILIGAGIFKSGYAVVK